MSGENTKLYLPLSIFNMVLTIALEQHLVSEILIKTALKV